MRCASALSTARNTDAAFRDVLDRVADGLAGEEADFALAFTSAHHADRLADLWEGARSRSLARRLVACTGESIVGEGREIEGSAAVSLWAIRLAGGPSRAIRLEFADGEFRGWPEDLPADRQTLLLLGDPFTFPADLLLKHLQSVAPGVQVLGGMASAGQAPGQNRLLLDGETFEGGAVGILLDSSTSVRSVVSQGCRPVGHTMIVTKADGNLIRELGRRPALEALREMFEDLPEADQALARQGLHVGRVINEYQGTFHRGDFLVRNVMGADPNGAIAIGDTVRVGQTVQFHVRDADSADEDLRCLLAEGRGAVPASGALLFTCNGRGSRLFSKADHDAGVIRESLGPIPVAGFFAMGEIGPVGGQNFLHGFTASVAIFESAQPARE